MAESITPPSLDQQAYACREHLLWECIDPLTCSAEEAFEIGQRKQSLPYATLPSQAFLTAWKRQQRDEASLRLICLGARHGSLSPFAPLPTTTRGSFLTFWSPFQDDEALLTYVTQYPSWKKLADRVEEFLPQSNVEGYLAISQRAQEQGWPVDYQTDLTKHDCRGLCSPGASNTFWWRLGEQGTDLFWPGDMGSASWVDGWFKTVKKDQLSMIWCHYDGQVLRDIELTQMVTQIIFSVDIDSVKRQIEALPDVRYQELLARPDPTRVAQWKQRQELQKRLEHMRLLRADYEYYREEEDA